MCMGVLILSLQHNSSDAHYKNKRYEHFMVSQSDLQVHACTLLNRLHGSILLLLLWFSHYNIEKNYKHFKMSENK